jgi:hypothetical protein
VPSDPLLVHESDHLHELRAAVSDAWCEAAELVRQHAALASREAADRTAGLPTDAAVLVAGVVCLHAAALALLAAAGLGLYAAGVAPWLASLAVALVTGAAGGGAMLMAKRRFLNRVRPPSETLLAVRETSRWVESMLRGTR